MLRQVSFLLWRLCNLTRRSKRFELSEGLVMNDQDKTREEFTEEIVYLGARVSELEHVKEILEKNESRFQSLFENMGNAVAVYRAEQDGEDFVLIDFNKAAEKIEQISRSEVLGKSVLKVFPGAKEFGLFDVFQRVWRTGCAEFYPFSEYKDNRIRGWRENFVYRLPSGEIVATYSDETERKRAEDALRESEEKYRLIFSKERDAIVVTHEASYEILDVNESCERLYGYTREDMLRMKALDLSAEPEKSLIALRQGVQPEGVVAHLRWHRKKDGTVFPVEISSSPFAWKGERVVCSLIRDITERRNAEDELREKEKLLQSILSTSPVGISLHL
jgi:PAS domain S-box-containing protein